VSSRELLKSPPEVLATLVAPTGERVTPDWQSFRAPRTALSVSLAIQVSTFLHARRASKWRRRSRAGAVSSLAMRIGFTALVPLLFVFACRPSPTPAAEVARTPIVAAGPASAPPSPISAPPIETEPPPPFVAAREEDARRFLHPPGPRETSKRYDHAVVLYARTQTIWDAGGKNEREETRLVPLVCILERRLATGRACMKGAPASGEVRLTDGTRHRVAGIKRGTEECTMAGEPRGKTDVWRLAKPVESDRPLLAIWPADADVGLVAHGAPEIAPTPAERALLHLDDKYGVDPTLTASLLQAFEEDLDGDGSKERVFSVLLDGQQPSFRADVVFLRGGAATSVDGTGPRHRAALATVDPVGNSRRYTIVLEEWVNDYGIGVQDPLGKSVYGYHCGNI